MDNFLTITLEKANTKLKEGLEFYQSNQEEIIRDALIKRFKILYELSTKSLKKLLEKILASSKYIEHMDFSDLIAYAKRKNLLLGNVENWKRYKNFYIRASYCCDETVFPLIVEEIPNFSAEVDYLLSKIKSHLV